MSLLTAQHFSVWHAAPKCCTHCPPVRPAAGTDPSVRPGKGRWWWGDPALRGAGVGAVMLGGVAIEKPLAELKIRRIKKKRERGKKKH